MSNMSKRWGVAQGSDVELVSARSSQNANPEASMPDSAIQLEVFPTELHLRRIDPAQNMRRA
jgi:hypothetical protein